MFAYISLSRPINCMMAAVGVYIGAVVSHQGISMHHSIALAAVAAIFAVAGGNALNDYVDRKVDKVVHPDRPIPSKKIPARNALMFSIIAFCACIILSSFVNPLCLIIAGLGVGTLILYELKLKSQGFAGNLCIALLIGLLFLFGGATVGFTPTLFVLCLLAAMTNFGREVTKDIADIKGDEMERKTLPMSLGVAATKKLAALLIVVAIILSPLPHFFGMSIYYISLVIPANLMFLYSSVQLFDHPSKSAKTIKLGMIIALAAFLAGGIG